MRSFFLNSIAARHLRQVFSLMAFLGVISALSVGTMPRVWALVPASPTNVVATPFSSTQINLTWTASSGATSYTVKRGSVSGGPYTTAGTPASVSYSDTGLTPATRYYYVVLAVNASGSSAPSAEVLRTTFCTAPTNLAATATSTQINLTWTASTGATSYSLYRGTTSGGESGTAYKTGLTSTSAADTSVTAGSTYYYTIKAVNNGGTSATSNEAIGTVPTSSPIGLTATAGDAQVLLTWIPVNNAIGYNVYRSTSAGGEGATPINTQPVTANAYLNVGLSAGTTYYYKFAAVYAAPPQSTSSSEATAATSASNALQDSNWALSFSATNSTSSTDTAANTAQAFSLASVQQTSAAAASSIYGQTSGSKHSQVSIGGTYTFTWSGAAWPSLYVVQALSQHAYQAIIGNATGTASVANTGGASLVSASSPSTDPSIFVTPAPTITCNATDRSNVIFVRSSSTHIAQSLTIDGTPTGTVVGWSDKLTNLSTTSTCYTQAWFQKRFSTPQSILLTFTVAPSDVTATTSVSSSMSTGLCSAIADVSETYFGF